jgi:hypothetical protein
MKYTQIFVLLALRAYAQTTTTLSVSEDGNCGLDFSQTCQGSRFGNCCSGKGFCGSTSDYCGADCQDAYGTCTSANSTLISSNGDCGATDFEGQICLGSTFGNCCSEKGFCGTTSDYCGTGCQAEYGNCGTNDASSSAGTAAGTSTPPTTSSSSTQAPSSATTSASSQAVTASSPGDGTQAASDLNTTSSDEDESLSSGAIAGVAIAAVGGAAILLGGIFFVLRRRRQQRQNAELDAGDAGPLPPKSAAGVSVSAITSDSGSISPYDYAPMPPPKNEVMVSEMAEKGEERAELSAAPGTNSRTVGSAAELPVERYT